MQQLRNTRRTNQLHGGKGRGGRTTRARPTVARTVQRGKGSKKEDRAKVEGQLTLDGPRRVVLGLSGVVPVFPVIRHAGIAENEPDQIGEARLGANIVRQDHDAALTVARCTPSCWRSGRRGRPCRSRDPAGRRRRRRPGLRTRSLRCSLTGKSGPKTGN